MGKICIAIFRGLRHREALAEKLITPSSPSRGIWPYSAFANARNPSYITPVFDSENLKCQRYVFLREFSTKPENEASRGLKSLKGGKIGKSVSKDTEGRGNEKLSSLDPAEINMKYDSEALFKEMHQSYSDKKKYEVTRRKFSKIFKHFKERRRSREPAQASYINSCDFPRAAKEFKSFFLSRANVDVLQYLSSLGPGAVADSFLSPIFTQFCQWKFPSEIEGFRGQLDCADLTKAHAWFPLARAMRRKIIYHCGPTNSGKTYNALQRFMDAQAGLYCGPLRLLAMEVFDKVNAQGVCCSLHTGQERRDLPFAKHVSCTVEMASTSQCYEVAVIDEIQMITDEYRGFAWSRALLGLQADEIHICGDPSVRQLIKDICAVTGDTLIENHYPRFKPLVVEAKTLLGNLQNVEKGDCIVAFSRREIFEIKMAIESLTSHRCCVIYGALPPETRTLQANLFNDPVSGYDVLVATDAVGMGLNLSIRRVVFYSLGKFTGDFVRPIPPSQVKQIAGRAGRRGSAYPEGLVTTFKLEDLDYLIECLKQPSEIASKAGLFPSFQQFKPFAKQFSDISFPRLLERFWECCRLDRHYFLCKHDNVKTVACMLEKVPGLSLEDRFNFCFAPVNTRDPEAMNYLRKFATDYSKHCPVRIFMDVPEQTAMDDEELSDLESKHLVLSVYLWLAHQFNHAFFPFTDKAESSAANIAHLLGESLANFNQEVTTPSENEAEESDAELIKQRFAELRELVTKQLAKKWRS